jgi:metal-responsive CopG/Arc/MetJ family transcriptional regulator
MKTAISIPDALFKAAEDAAKRLAISRSELYVRAVEEYLRTHSDADVTTRLNVVYASQSSDVDPAIYDAAVRSVGSDEW